MSELKFTCQTCGQPILVAASEAGRKLVCPACKTQLTIPGPQSTSREPPAVREGGDAVVADSGPLATPARPERTVQEEVTLPPAPSNLTTSLTPPVPPAEGKSSLRLEPSEAPAPIASSQAAAAVLRVLTPEQDTRPEIPVTAKPGTSAQPAPRVEPAAPSPPKEAPPAADGALEPVQVAVLTSALKRSIVGAARELIADPSHWIPGVGDKGKLAYAARETKGRLKPVEPGVDEATHHSLMGAVLRELHRRNVAPTATGRTDFLDRDIPDAIRRIIPEGAEVGDGTKLPEATDPRLMSISHAQCLKVFDLLERDYAARVTADADRPARIGGRGANLDELLVRAARDEVVMVTEVLRATHAELVALNHRVTELEKAASNLTPSTPPK